MKIVLALAFILLSASAIKFDAAVQESIISAVNSDPTSTWKAGVNEYFADMEMDQIRHMMGVLESPNWLELEETDLTPSNDIPTEFDPRTEWPDCESIKEVRDQSTCGSCWAFGAVEAFSDRICVNSKQKLQTRVSSQDLLSCCGLWCGNGCNGGYPSAAWRYFSNKGCVTGDLYESKDWCQSYSLPPCEHHTTGPYPECKGDSPTPQCKKECISEYGKKWEEDKQYVEKAYSVSGISKIQTELMTYGPTEASFTVYEDFLSYKSGVYEHKTGAALGGHAIKLMGWGVEDGVDYWLVANSWNETWGDKGFFKIKRGNDECGIESGIVAGKVKA